ncbi:MAG: hypothetical protein JSV55_14495 [Deltaproteobacteria bacterium]|nr:MAG: hypothetical protein JSV40_09830 [Deltaproteobacteria bacterium]UCH07258.1 MAG: hypothetical protein JSV55_14495 [Deltaproteobacteria bacterium]
MDSTEQHIIKEYRQADFERRLHIFLTYPSLRSQLSEIDDREGPVIHPDFVEFQQIGLKVSATLRSVLQWVGGLLRGCRYPVIDK